MSAPEIQRAEVAEESSAQTSQQRLVKLLKNVRDIRKLDPVKDYKEAALHSYAIRYESDYLSASTDSKEELRQLKLELEDWKKSLNDVVVFTEIEQIKENIDHALLNTTQALQYPGPILSNAELASTTGALMGSSMAGLQLSTSVLSGVVPPFLASLSGVIGGVALPMLANKVADAIEDAKTRAIVKTVLNAGIVTGAALLAPWTLPYVGTAMALNFIVGVVSRLIRGRPVLLTRRGAIIRDQKDLEGKLI